MCFVVEVVGASITDRTCTHRIFIFFRVCCVWNIRVGNQQVFQLVRILGNLAQGIHAFVPYSGIYLNRTPTMFEWCVFRIHVKNGIHQT